MSEHCPDCGSEGDIGDGYGGLHVFTCPECNTGWVTDGPDDVPGHYEGYDCPNCPNTEYTAPRVEDTDIGVTCSRCGTAIAGGGR